MNLVFDTLRELMPVGVAALLCGYIYLAKLFRDLSAQVADLAKQQTDYLKQRLEIIEKSTGVFERTIIHQERELERLKKKNAAAQQRLDRDQAKVESLLRSMRAVQTSDAPALDRLGNATRDLALGAKTRLVELERETLSAQDRIAELWRKNTAEADEEVAMLEWAQRRKTRSRSAAIPSN